MTQNISKLYLNLTKFYIISLLKIEAGMFAQVEGSPDLHAHKINTFYNNVYYCILYYINVVRDPPMLLPNIFEKERFHIF